MQEQPVDFGGGQMNDDVGIYVGALIFLFVALVVFAFANIRRPEDVQ